MPKNEREITKLSKEQKDLIAETSVMPMLAYAIWAFSIKDPEKALASKELIDNRINKTPTHSKEYLKDKVERLLSGEDSRSIQYLTNVGKKKVEEMTFPELGDDVAIELFWGNTGFSPGAQYPSKSKVVDEKELKKSAESYMGSVVLVGPREKPKEQKLYIVFRGSRSGNTSFTSMLQAKQGRQSPDWVTDLDLGKNFSLSKPLTSKVGDIFSSLGMSERYGIHHHSGIAKAYASCRPGIIAALKELGIDSLENFKGQIITTGHSLGGGLATLCAYDLRGGFADERIGTFSVPLSSKVLKVSDPEKLTCISYSAPAVGNDLFAKQFAESVPNSFRVVIDSDPITVELKDSMQVHHVHGKVDLPKFVDDPKKLPEHLKFKSVDISAHEPAKVMELSKFIADQKYIPLAKIISNANLKLHIEIDHKITHLINLLSLELSKDKSPADLKKRIQLLEALSEKNQGIIKFCATSHAKGDNNQAYVDQLNKLIKSYQENLAGLKKLTPSKFDSDLRDLFLRSEASLKAQVETMSSLTPALHKSIALSIFGKPPSLPAVDQATDKAQQGTLVLPDFTP